MDAMRRQAAKKRPPIKQMKVQMRAVMTAERVGVADDEGTLGMVSMMTRVKRKHSAFYKERFKGQKFEQQN